MALSQPALASALAQVFGATGLSASEAAEELAAAYSDYAAGGLFGASAPQIAPALTEALAGAIESAIASPEGGTAVAFGAAWSAGLAAFWVDVPVAGAQAGATVACPGAAALAAPAAAAVSNPANTSSSAADALAATLHIATLTVTAAVAPPPGTVLPIT